jgi:hypothetical protein
MAEEQPSLHIDTDWKKQAQEEKKRLAEKAAAAKAAPPAVAPVPPGPGAAGPLAGAAAPADPRSPGRGGARGERELPPASIATLAQSLMTQALYYLGELAYQGGDPVVGLDMAKHHIDTLAVLEDKTGSNLTDEERHALDTALYEARSRFVSVASQFI